MRSIAATAVVILSLSTVPTRAEEGGASVVADPAAAYGEWNERVAIELPPAARGVAPELAIVASHRTVDGELGGGWRLAGGSAIVRRAATGGVPEHTATMSASQFRVDGTLLVSVTGPGTAHYQPESYDGSRFDYVVATDTWTRKRDGWTWTYGDTAANATRRIATASPLPVCGAPCNTERWYLRSVVDPFGNRIDYSYRVEALPSEFAATYPTQPTTRDHLLSTITYGAGTAVVSFTYGLRPDPRVELSAGFPVFRTHRLTEIRSVAGAAPAQEYSRYRLQYVDETGGGLTDCDNASATAMATPVRTLLRKVTRAAGATSGGRVVRCNTYHQQAIGWGSAVGATDAIANPFDGSPAGDEIDPLTDSWTPMPVELDGDGRTDLVLLAYRQGDAVPNKHHVYVATPNRAEPFATGADGGQAGIVAASWEAHISFAFDDITTARALVDLDGDVIPEVIYENNGALLIDKATSAFDASGAMTGVSFAALTHTLDRCDARYGQFVDVDGDRRPDLVVRPHGADNACASQPTTRWIRNLRAAPWFVSTAAMTLAVPLERATPPAAWTTALAACPGGAVSWPADYKPEWNAARYVGEQVRVDDFNDDGLADLAYALYGCWSEGVRWAPYTASAYSAIHYGDGKGGFVDSGLSAGPPVLLDAAQWGGTGDTRITHGTLATLDLDRDGWSELLGTTLSSDGSSFGIGARPNYNHRPPQPPPVPQPPLWLPPISGFAVSKSALIAPAPAIEDHVGQAWDCLATTKQPTWGDFDGDGFLDRLVIEGEAPSGLLTGWSALVYFSSRTTAQGRLVTTDNAHGGRTRLTWGWSAELPNANPDLPVNVEVIREVDGPGGNHALRYERATLAGGELTPFAQVTVAGDRGGVEVYAFITAPYARGAQHLGVRYRDDGSVEHVTVQEHGYRSGAAMSVDVARPYFNPLVRRCEFDVGFAIDLDAAVEDCRGVAWRAPAVGQSVGAATTKVAVSSTDYRIALGHDRSAAAGATTLFQQVWGASARPRVGLAAETYQVAFTRAVAAVGTPGTGDFFRWPVPAELAAAVPDVAAAEAGYQRPIRPFDPRAMFAWDWAYNHAVRRLEVRYAHRDLATLADDLRIDPTWAQPDATGYWYRLTTERTDDSAEVRLTQLERSNFSGFDDARTVSRCGRFSPADCATETYTLFANGTVRTHTLPDGTLESWTRLTWCGEPLTYTDPLGQVTTYNRTASSEKRCLLRSLSTGGATTTITYDLLLRPLTETIAPGGGAPATAIIARSFYYDDAWTFAATIGAREDAAYSEPRRAIRRGDGQLELIHEDGLGRTTRRSLCTDTGSATTGGDIALVGCQASSRRNVEWTLYGADGLAKVTAGPFDPGQTPTTTAIAHDHLGRPAVISVPADLPGAPAWWPHTIVYGAGYEERTEPTATGTLTTRRDHATLREAVRVGGVDRGSTTYDALGNVTLAVEPDGIATRLSYDGQHRLDREVRADATGAVLREQCVRGDGTTQLAAAEHAITGRDARGRVIEEILPDDTEVAYTYDGLDRLLTRSIDGVLVESRTYQAATATVRGRVRVTDEVGGAQTVSEVDGLGRTWARTAPRTSQQWSFDGAGHLATHTDDGGRVTQYTFSRRDDLISVLSPAAGLTTFDYDGRARVQRRTDADGAAETFGYTYAGSLHQHKRGSILLRERSYDAQGRVVSSTDRGVATAAEYDALDRLTRFREGVDGASELRVTSYFYDAGDRVTEVRRTPAGGMLTAATIYDHDAWGRLRQQTDPLGAVTSYQHDVAGRLRRVRDPAGIELETRYDDYGRVSQQQLAHGGWQTTTYAGRQTLDAELDLWLVTTQDSEDAARAVSTQRYVDGAGHALAELYPDGTSRRWTWTAGQVTRDELRAADGTVYRATDHAYEPATGRAHATTTGPYSVSYRYTTAGRLDRITTPDDVLERTYSNGLLATYREAGVSHRLIRGATSGWIDREEVSSTSATRTIDTARDRLGRPRRVETNDGTRPAVIEAFAGYDYFDRPWVETRTIGGIDVIEARTYDAVGRPRSRTTSGTGLPARTTQWAWQTNGLLAAMTAPSGTTLSYDYGAPADHRLDVVRAGNTTLVRIDGRDARGAITALTLPTLGQARTFDYDDRGRLETTTTAAMPPTPSFETARTYYPDGKLATDTVSDLVGTASWTSEYQYDGAGRLVEELVGKTGVRNVYGLDAAGNRLTTTTTAPAGVPTVTMTATYAGPRLNTVDGSALGYDAWNDVTADHHGNSYARNADGALAVLSRGATGAALFRNARGEPVATVEGLGVRRTAWGLTPGLPVEVEAADGSDLTYLTVEGMHLGVLDDGVLTPVEADPRGTVVQHGAELLGDASGFGAGLVAPTGVDDRFTFAMLERVPAAREVMLARVRTYDPRTGRFLERDPIGAAGGLELYQYGAGDPINHVDPWGDTPIGADCSTTSLSNFGLEPLKPRTYDFEVSQIPPSIDQQIAANSTMGMYAYLAVEAQKSREFWSGVTERLLHPLQPWSGIPSSGRPTCGTSCLTEPEIEQHRKDLPADIEIVVHGKRDRAGRQAGGWRHTQPGSMGHGLAPGGTQHNLNGVGEAFLEQNQRRASATRASGLSPLSHAQWDGFLDGAQLTLDAVGLVPGWGEPADLLNAGISAGRGNWVDAGLSVAAMVPFAGTAATAAKVARKVDKYLLPVIGVGTHADDIYRAFHAVEDLMTSEPAMLGALKAFEEAVEAASAHLDDVALAPFIAEYGGRLDEAAIRLRAAAESVLREAEVRHGWPEVMTLESANGLWNFEFIERMHPPTPFNDFDFADALHGEITHRFQMWALMRHVDLNPGVLGPFTVQQIQSGMAWVGAFHNPTHRDIVELGLEAKTTNVLWMELMDGAGITNAAAPEFLTKHSQLLQSLIWESQ